MKVKSWKTTASGVAILLATVLTGVSSWFDSDPGTSFGFDQIAGVIAGIGFLFARDNDKSSEDVGAKK